MHLRYFFLIGFLWTIQYVFASEQLALTNSTKTWRDASTQQVDSDRQQEQQRKAYKLIAAQVQALRNFIVVEYPTLFARKKYKSLELLVLVKAHELGIPYKKYNFLINLRTHEYHSITGNLSQDIARYYGKYSDNPDDLPDTIRMRRSYAKYNK